MDFSHHDYMQHMHYKQACPDLAGATITQHYRAWRYHLKGGSPESIAVSEKPRTRDEMLKCLERQFSLPVLTLRPVAGGAE